MLGLLSFNNIKIVAITGVIVFLGYFYLDLYTDYKKAQSQLEKYQLELNALNLELTICNGNVADLRNGLERSMASINEMALKNQNIELELKKWQISSKKDKDKLKSILSQKNNGGSADEVKCLELNKRIGEMKYEDF